MKDLADFKEDIHKCSKCGLCQAVCPVYQITKNDCTVSRGQFIMLKGLINGHLKMTKKLNHYLDLCLKCGMCSKFCPSGIDAVDIIVAAKHEYFKRHTFEKFISSVQKNLIFGFIPNLISKFNHNCKSKEFERKVIYFGGCNAKLKGDFAVVNILNSLNIEVVNPNFPCCGIAMFVRGDLNNFKDCIKRYIQVLKKYNIDEVVTTCASCEKTLKDYARWADNSEDKEYLSKIKVKNIYSYIKENNLKLKLKNPCKVTYHKPCNLDNYEDIEWILNNTENLNYIKMKDYDKCCGLNGLTKFKEYGTVYELYKAKLENITDIEPENVLTSCLGCEIALKLILLCGGGKSGGEFRGKSCNKEKIRVVDLITFLGKNIHKT